MAGLCLPWLPTAPRAATLRGPKEGDRVATVAQARCMSIKMSRGEGRDTGVLLPVIEADLAPSFSRECPLAHS